MERRPPERTEEEYETRERLISRIEAIVGTLSSMPWSQLDTSDIAKLYAALVAQ